MSNFINWCNTNSGFLTAIMSLIGLLLSGVAIWISISVSRKQNKITLFDKRYKIIEAYKQMDQICNAQSVLIMRDHMPIVADKKKTILININPDVDFKKDSIELYESLYPCVLKICIKIEKNSMLFDNQTEEALLNLSESFRTLFFYTLREDDNAFEDCLRRFKKTFDYFKDNHYEKVKRACKM